MKSKEKTRAKKPRAVKHRIVKHLPPRPIQVRVTYVGFSPPFDRMLFQAAGEVVGATLKRSKNSKTVGLRYSDGSGFGFGMNVRDHSWLFEGKDWEKACALAETFAKIPGLRSVDMIVDALMVEEMKPEKPIKAKGRRKP